MNSLEKLKVAVWNVDKCILVSRGISVDTTKPLWNREEKTSRNNLAFTFGQFHYQGHNYHSHSQKWEDKIIKKLDQVNCAKVKYSHYIVYLKNLHPLKKITLKNIRPWKLVAHDKYSPMKNIHSWKIFTPIKYWPLKNIQPQ